MHIELVNMWEYSQVHCISFISTDLLFVFSKVKATRASVCRFYILLTFSSYIPQSMFQPGPHSEPQFAQFVSHQPGILIPSRGNAQSAHSESVDEMKNPELSWAAGAECSFISLNVFWKRPQNVL